MFTVYALKSINFNFIYVGMTENLNERLIRHNNGYVRSTKRYAPFELFYFEFCINGREAREREKCLKSTSGKRFLKSVLNSRVQSGNSVDAPTKKFSDSGMK